jgi:hypothetical protein
MRRWSSCAKPFSGLGDLLYALRRGINEFYVSFVANLLMQSDRRVSRIDSDGGWIVSRAIWLIRRI